MDIVLLGATGFVGSAVLSAAASYARVHALIRSRRNLSALPPSVRVVEGDLGDLPKDLFPHEPHVVIHLATKQIDADGSGFDEVNVKGAGRLVAHLNEATQGILYGSSVSVYGQDEQWQLDESAPLRPGTPLARSRASAEDIILKAAKARAIAAYCLRPRFIFGHGDRHTLPGLVRMVRRGVQPGTGAQRYSIIGREDYASILLSIAARIHGGAPPEQTGLNVGYVRPVSLEEVVSLICDRFRLRRPWMHLPVRCWMTAGLRLVGAERLATQLELFGLSHTFRVERLRSRTAAAIVSRDPISVLEGVICC